MKNINLIADEQYIPLNKHKSKQVLELVTKGVSRKVLSNQVKNYHGAPLEDLEGKRYGYWLIDRYVDEHGENALKLNYRHVSGNIELDREARTIRRKQRASDCLKKNSKEVKRTPKVMLENNEAQKEYFLSLGKSANDSENKKTSNN